MSQNHFLLPLLASATLVVFLFGVFSFKKKSLQQSQPEAISSPENEDVDLSLDANIPWEKTLATIEYLSMKSSLTSDPRRSLQVIFFLEHHANNLRSKLSCSALQALEQSFSSLSKDMLTQEELSRITKLLLLKSSALEKKFIAEKAKSCLHVLLTRQNIVNMLIDASLDSKNTKLVGEAILAVQASADRWGISQEEVAKLVQLEPRCKSAQTRNLVHQLIAQQDTPSKE